MTETLTLVESADIVNIDSLPIKGADISTTIWYIKPSEDGVVERNGDLVAMVEEYLDPKQVHIRDIRVLEKKPTLEENGFQFLSQSLPDIDYLDDSSIQAVYFPTMEKWIKEV
jgi:hypothetical protein